MKEIAAKVGLTEQIENLKNYYSRLSEREQMIFILSCAGGAVALLVLICTIMLGANAAISSKISSNRKNLQTISDLGAKYRALSQNIAEIEQRINQAPNFQLGTELEMLAQQNSIKIGSIKDKPSTPHEFYTESQVVVDISQVQLRPLIDFLFAIENSQKLMRISSLRISPDFKDAKLLKVTFNVSTFQHKNS
jgi:hypothetical protein